MKQHTYIVAVISPAWREAIAFWRQVNSRATVFVRGEAAPNNECARGVAGGVRPANFCPVTSGEIASSGWAVMKKYLLCILLGWASLFCVRGQLTAPGTVDFKADAESEKKASQWVAALKLADAERISRVEKVVAIHLTQTRDWINTHSFTNVPAGINPATGQALSNLDRQIIAASAQPKSYHADLMAGLRRELTEEQVETILDKYTSGKVAFTMRGYYAIVPDLTPTEATNILGFLKQAREQAVDYSNMKLVSAIFDIYKAKSEQYLNANGRNWKQLYSAYVKTEKAKKETTRTNTPSKSK